MEERDEREFCGRSSWRLWRSPSLRPCGRAGRRPGGAGWWATAPTLTSGACRTQTTTPGTCRRRCDGVCWSSNRWRDRCGHAAEPSGPGCGRLLRSIQVVGWPVGLSEASHDALYSLARGTTAEAPVRPAELTDSLGADRIAASLACASARSTLFGNCSRHLRRPVLAANVRNHGRENETRTEEQRAMCESPLKDHHPM